MGVCFWYILKLRVIICWCFGEMRLFVVVVLLFCLRLMMKWGVGRFIIGIIFGIFFCSLMIRDFVIVVMCWRLCSVREVFML